MSKVDSEIAVIVPVRNEEKTILPLLESFERLTLLPKELVLVDGGSMDKTIECITRYLEGRKLPYQICLLALPEALPGRGRNEGIRKTECPLVACTDAGGTVDPRWLEELMTPMKSDDSCDMVIGNCRPDAKSFFERCTFYVYLGQGRRKEFAFSGGASVAFRKKLWSQVGGYPEALYPCEDKAFLEKVKKEKAHVFFSDGAFVYWRSRTTVREFFKQYFLYGRGDGEGGFVGHRYLARLLFYGALLILSIKGKYLMGLVTLAAYLAFLSVRGCLTLRAFRALLILPFLFCIKDLAQLLGYGVGMARRYRETD